MVAALAFILLEMDVGFVLVIICFERSSAVLTHIVQVIDMPIEFVSEPIETMN